MNARLYHMTAQGLGPVPILDITVTDVLSFAAPSAVAEQARVQAGPVALTGDVLEVTTDAGVFFFRLLPTGFAPTWPRPPLEFAARGSRAVSLALRLAREAAREDRGSVKTLTHQYSPEDCPGRPCGDGCDHRGVPPTSVKIPAGSVVKLPRAYTEPPIHLESKILVVTLGESPEFLGHPGAEPKLSGDFSDPPGGGINQDTALPFLSS